MEIFNKILLKFFRKTQKEKRKKMMKVFTIHYYFKHSWKILNETKNTVILLISISLS